MTALSPVGHAEVHGVRPERRVGQWRGDGRVVQESLFLHHGELVVAAHPQIGRPQADHAVVDQVGVLFRDYAHAGHLFGPVLHGGVAPELLVVVVPAKKKAHRAHAWNDRSPKNGLFENLPAGEVECRKNEKSSNGFSIFSIFFPRLLKTNPVYGISTTGKIEFYSKIFRSQKSIVDRIFLPIALPNAFTMAFDLTTKKTQNKIDYRCRLTCVLNIFFLNRLHVKYPAYRFVAGRNVIEKPSATEFRGPRAINNNTL